jgi:ornithine decarboxylase
LIAVKNMQTSHTRTKDGLNHRAALANIVSERIDPFLDSRGASTPFLAIDLRVVRYWYVSLREAMPYASIFYAVKANPSADVISSLTALGASFDLASEGEIERCSELGLTAKLSHSGTPPSARRGLQELMLAGSISLHSTASANLRNSRAPRQGPGCSAGCWYTILVRSGR